jgi:hypothetical protein
MNHDRRSCKCSKKETSPYRHLHHHGSSARHTNSSSEVTSRWTQPLRVWNLLWRIQTKPIFTLTQVRHLIIRRSSLASQKSSSCLYIYVSYKDACTQRYCIISPKFPFQGIRCLCWRDQACASSRRLIIVKLTYICSPKPINRFWDPGQSLGQFGIVRLANQVTLSDARTLEKLRRPLLRRSTRFLIAVWKSSSVLENLEGAWRG